MDFAKIKYFLTLADTLNYTKASEQLFISQSMLSRHIKAAEEEFGMTLFTRSTRGVALTSAGSILAKGLKNLSMEYDALLSQARSAHSGYSGEIKIGVFISCALGRMSELIQKYEDSNPEVNIVLSTVGSPGELYTELIKEQIDFAYGIGMDIMFYPKLSSIMLSKNPVCIVMSKRHPLAKAEKQSLSIQDFRNETFITPADETSNAFRELLARCSKAGFTPKVITVQNIMTVALWVEANRGVTFLHETNALLGNPNLVAHYLRDIEQNGSNRLYWNVDNQEPKNLAFLQFIRENIDNEIEE